MLTNCSTFHKLSSNSQTAVYHKTNVLQNAKGHSHIGMLTLRRNHHVNPYFEHCTTLHTTTYALCELYELDSTEEVDFWRDEVYKKLFDYVSYNMQPSFDDVNDMFDVCEVLLDKKMKHELKEFISNSPKKFLNAYAIKSLTTPYNLYKLEKLGLNGVKEYIMNHLDETEHVIWSNIYKK
jgi:hypothetical protein